MTYRIKLRKLAARLKLRLSIVDSALENDPLEEAVYRTRKRFDMFLMSIWLLTFLSKSSTVLSYVFVYHVFLPIFHFQVNLYDTCKYRNIIL